MTWAKFIQHHKTLLLTYFPFGCSKCLYGNIQCKSSDIQDNEFMIILSNELEPFGDELEPFGDELEPFGYEMPDLCEKCLADTPRTIYEVVFDILRQVLELHESGDFTKVMDILNQNNIIIRPKEALFIHYIKKCKMEQTIERYILYLNKLLKLGIDENYQFSKSYHSCSFAFLPVQLIRGGANNTITREILNLLSKNEYNIYTHMNGLVYMSNLVKFIIFG
jgi:hypothetical protein